MKTDLQAISVIYESILKEPDYNRESTDNKPNNNMKHLVNTYYIGMGPITLKNSESATDLAAAQSRANTLGLELGGDEDPETFQDGELLGERDGCYVYGAGPDYCVVVHSADASVDVEQIMHDLLFTVPE